MSDVSHPPDTEILASPITGSELYVVRTRTVVIAIVQPSNKGQANAGTIEDSGRYVDCVSMDTDLP